MWENNAPLPPELCGPKDATPQNPLWQYGFYRILNDGKIEFISFCDAKSREWLAIYYQDLENLLDAYVPKDSPAAREFISAEDHGRK